MTPACPYPHLAGPARRPGANRVAAVVHTDFSLDVSFDGAGTHLLDASDVAEAEEAQVGERAAQTGEAGQHVGDEGEGIVGGHRVVGRGGLLQGAARICRSSFDEKQGLVAAKGMAAKKSTNIERE